MNNRKPLQNFEGLFPKGRLVFFPVHPLKYDVGKYPVNILGRLIDSIMSDGAQGGGGGGGGYSDIFTHT